MNCSELESWAASHKMSRCTLYPWLLGGTDTRWICRPRPLFFLCIPSPSLLCLGRFECKLCDTLHLFRSTTFPSVLHTVLTYDSIQGQIHSS
ncbi:hypothetical protein TEQG_01808, partial [Trichophyton equinum CBS 127.97]